MDKIDRLLDAMEHPECYTPTEIKAMLHDPEVKEMFDLIDKTKSSLQTITMPDIDDEWKRFEEEHRVSENQKSHWFAGLFSRNAAAGIAIAIASITAVAALVGVGLHRINTNRETTAKETEAATESKTTPILSDTIKSIETANDKTAETIVFDDEPLETILSRIAGYYDCKVAFNNEASKSLRLYFRWNQGNTLDEVVERLNNFEQIKITVKDRTIKVD